MKAFSMLVFVALIAGIMPIHAADYYRLPDVKRIDKDLYRSADVMIETLVCFHLAIGEEALLKYEGPGEYEIVWRDHSTCDVQKIVALERNSSKIAKLRTQNRTRRITDQIPIFFKYYPHAKLKSIWSSDVFETHRRICREI